MSKNRKKPGRLSRTKGPMGLVVIAIIAIVPLLSMGSAAAYGAHLENNDAFCGSCHTEPESTYVARASAAAADSNAVHDLAAFHATQDQPVACIQCHSGVGVMGRIDAMKLGARDMAAYVRASYPQPSPLTHAIADVNCIKCHQDYAKDRSFDNHYHILLTRWQASAPDKAAACVDCHASHTQDGQAKIAFLNKDHTVSQCNACHRVMGD